MSLPDLCALVQARNTLFSFIAIDRANGTTIETSARAERVTKVISC